MSLTLRRFSDLDLISAMNHRGYTVRRNGDARRELIVESQSEMSHEFKAAALEAIRAKLILADLQFESVPTAIEGVTLHRAALRIL